MKKTQLYGTLALVLASILITVWFAGKPANPAPTAPSPKSASPSTTKAIPQSSITERPLAAADAEVPTPQPKAFQEFESETTPEPTIPDEIDLDDPYYILLATGRQELVERLKAEGVVEVYRDAEEELRLDLVAFLADTNELETYMLQLMAMESDSSIRAWLLINYRPKNAFETVDLDKLAQDSTLIEALSMPVSTDISVEEHVERIRVAGAADDDLTLDQIAGALRDFPEDEYLQFRAAEGLLGVSQRSGAVAEQDVREAEKMLVSSLSQPVGNSPLDATDRIRGYLALINWGTEEERREFYKQQLQQENDPRAIDVLINLYNQASQIEE